MGWGFHLALSLQMSVSKNSHHCQTCGGGSPLLKVHNTCPPCLAETFPTAFVEAEIHLEITPFLLSTTSCPVPAPTSQSHRSAASPFLQALADCGMQAYWTTCSGCLPGFFPSPKVYLVNCVLAASITTTWYSGHCLLFLPYLSHRLPAISLPNSCLFITLC